MKSTNQKANHPIRTGNVNPTEPSFDLFHRYCHLSHRELMSALRAVSRHWAPVRRAFKEIEDRGDAQPTAEFLEYVMATMKSNTREFERTQPNVAKLIGIKDGMPLQPGSSELLYFVMWLQKALARHFGRVKTVSPALIEKCARKVANAMKREPQWGNWNIPWCIRFGCGYPNVRPIADVTDLEAYRQTWLTATAALGLSVPPNERAGGEESSPPCAKVTNENAGNTHLTSK
jgi:hypothetical protein